MRNEKAKKQLVILNQTVMDQRNKLKKYFHLVSDSQK